MIQPYISIVVPSYNQAAYLNDCLQSVLDQTYKKWECLIIDDGSPDKTEEVAKKWIEKDVRFKYFKKENGGVSSARNFGIEKANGKWILPLDGDDKIGSKYLELASKEFDNCFDLIYCEAEFFGEMQGCWPLRPYSYSDLLIISHIFCSAFFRKKLWSASAGYDESLVYGMEDWDFWLEIVKPDTKVKKLDYVGFYYRRKKESRDTLLNESAKKTMISETHIYKKHLYKYLPFAENPIINYRIQTEKNRNLDRILSDINKNFFTKILYKVIEKF